MNRKLAASVMSHKNSFIYAREEALKVYYFTCIKLLSHPYINNKSRSTMMAVVQILSTVVSVRNTYKFSCLHWDKWVTFCAQLLVHLTAGRWWSSVASPDSQGESTFLWPLLNLTSIFIKTHTHTTLWISFCNWFWDAEEATTQRLILPP